MKPTLRLIHGVPHGDAIAHPTIRVRGHLTTLYTWWIRGALRRAARRSDRIVLDVTGLRVDHRGGERSRRVAFGAAAVLVRGAAEQIRHAIDVLGLRPALAPIG